MLFASSVFSNFLFAFGLLRFTAVNQADSAFCFRSVPCQWMRIIGSLRFCASPFVEKDRVFSIFFHLVHLPTFFTPSIVLSIVSLFLPSNIGEVG